MKKPHVIPSLLSGASLGIVLGVTLAGCGGSGDTAPRTLSAGASASTASRAAGGATISIAWPKAEPVTRLIPQKTQSGVIELLTDDPRANANAPVQQHYWINLPTNTPASEITVNGVEAHTYSVRITALPTPRPAMTTDSGTGGADISQARTLLAGTLRTLVLVKDRTDARLQAALASTIKAREYTLVDPTDNNEYGKGSKGDQRTPNFFNADFVSVDTMGQ